MSRKTPDLGDRESRERRHHERLATDNPSCLLCDTKAACIIELHHVAGRKYHAEMVPLCRNHHGIASDLAKDHPPKIPNCINPAEITGHFYLGLGDLAEIAADELRDPMLADFLVYLRSRLKEHGLFLIELARRAPNLAVGIAS